VLALLALAVPAAAADSEDALPVSAQDVKARWHGRLDGRHFTARVVLELDLGGMRERRELVVWRSDESGSEERVLIRFEAPADLRDLGILYAERAGMPNDYFLYQPELRRVRRLPEAVANDDVYGIDLEFLGFGVAQSEPTELESVTQESVEGRRAWRLAERALRENPRFEERTTWLDADSYIPLRTEQRRRGATRLVARTLETRAVQGTPTPVRMEFEDLERKRRVSLLVASIDYESAIPEEYFRTLALYRQSVAGPKE
jgi:hypothetical protein